MTRPVVVIGSYALTFALGGAVGYLFLPVPSPPPTPFNINDARSVIQKLNPLFSPRGDWDHRGSTVTINPDGSVTVNAKIGYSGDLFGEGPDLQSAVRNLISQSSAVGAVLR